MAGNRFSFVTYSDDNNGCVVKSDDQKNKKEDGSGVVDGKLIFTCPVEFRKEVTGINFGWKVVTGQVGHGKAIPVPSGYTRAQCKYMVSAAYATDGHTGSKTLNCSVNATTGVVTITGFDGRATTANYMVIASK